MSLFNGKAKFITSATKIEECPPENFPEVCFAGRSNVGKSSLINAIVNRKNIARTSNVPGKTQQMNYYQIGEDCFLVDLPGYGFAKVPRKERDRWGRTIRQYLSERESLKLILSVIDARHEPSGLDQDFFYWLASNEMPFCVLMSKADKLSKNKFAQSKKAVKNILAEMNIDVPILGYSASSRQGIPEIQELITDFIQH
ncbi:MAG TPA: YihA family ribosome biogenesis GTP-binding protein [Balneola sp.]|jgi:GTP-binding protein|nr:YihA family ribosome biogenesis GTP-binding protein [Bacteroidota bacterium]MAC06410.1 YihA family ribosome biogenesis GTP-binding protein [Balneola sp.]MAO78603.1 YihA family ribosome biogenesis GTP-binding protein [Balneola sp.]MBF63168.1 YihA family ribosome biogenesis GTP-binding protein [Balneola sp.]HAH51244.1 YihA family ribosome biogenesis GTP-binding protein [Balneola sp.]|tara:strand:- start:3239 stop:3835 length:597 start_codon:yes stop_codon:yes gene_type:complete